VDELRNYLGSSVSASPEMMKHMIGDRKMIITIIWNQQSFHLIDALPKGQKFNACYYTDMIL
jgi:hypothetical protein